MQAPQASQGRPRPLGRWELFGRIVITLLVVGIGLEIVAGPIPDTQAGEVQVMRTQLAALSAYPGSRLDRLQATDEFLRPVEVLYRVASYRCRSSSHQASSYYSDSGSRLPQPDGCDTTASDTAATPSIFSFDRTCQSAPVAW